MKLVNGAPRTPNVQGLVEQSNGVVKAKIRAWKAENGSSHWKQALPEICMQMNGQYHSTIGCRPWEVVFRNRKPPVWLTAEERHNEEGVHCEDGGIITEESLQAELKDQSLQDFLRVGERVPDRTAEGGSMAEAEPKTQPIPLLAPTHAPVASAKSCTKSPPPPNHVAGQVSILSKDHTGDPFFKSGRHIAIATLPDFEEGEKAPLFHNSSVPKAHLLLFFVTITDTETFKPVPGGQLGYTDKEDDSINISQLYKGKPFVWPAELVVEEQIQRTRSESMEDIESDPDALPPDYKADLAAPIRSDSSVESEEETDPVLSNVRGNTLRARAKMVQKYSRKHKIEVFVPGDVIALNLPAGTKTSTDNKRIWAKVIAEEHPGRYRLQTKWGILKTLVPTRELNRVKKVIADSLEMEEYMGPSTSILLSTAALKASSSIRVVISCKCKVQCATKRCSCFKNNVKCSVHCHHNSEHDCGFLASLALRTEVALVTKESEKKGGKKGKAVKRRRANTEGDTIN